MCDATVNVRLVGARSAKLYLRAKPTAGRSVERLERCLRALLEEERDPDVAFYARQALCAVPLAAEKKDSSG